MSRVQLVSAMPIGTSEAVLNALPLPVIVVGADGRISDANVAAETFFEVSVLLLRRYALRDLVPFGSPLLALVEQVRTRGAAVNEYKVDLSTPRTPGERLVDLYVAPLPERDGHVVVMLQGRTIADKMDRQLTHRGAARSVIALAAMLAHEIKNPLSGIRGAAQLLEQSAGDDDRTLTRLICDEADRIVKLVDRMEVFADERPVERQPVNIHAVLEHVKKLAHSGFARHIRFVEDYDPSLPPVLRQPRPARAGVPQPHQECRRSDRRRGGRRDPPDHGVPPRRAAVPAGLQDARLAADGILRPRQRSGRARRPDAASVRSVRHHQAERKRARARDGRQDRRGSRRRGRMRVAVAAHDLSRVDAEICRRRPAAVRCCLKGSPKMPAGSILVADDDAAIRTVLNQALSRAGYEVRSTGNAATLWRWVSQGDGDLVITDVVMPDENAFDLLPRIKKLRPDLPVVVMSAQNTFMTAIRASERGAYEYLPKPFDLKELIAIVGRALAEPKERSRPATAAEEFESIPLVGRSPAMQEIYRLLARLMQTDLTVMISGESGTGKELVARALHDYGKRRSGPFVAINMAAIPRDLIESELFGHEKGAFTGATTRSAGRFEQAEGGTLFLDEIGDMPMEAQTRLLRVLQQGEYTTVGGRTPIKTDVRIIAASNKDLRQLIQQGLFREDLYFRLNVVPLRLPPLRERTEDVPDLIRHFFTQAEREGLPPKQIDVAAIERLKRYRWPGNVRELENLARRLAALYPAGHHYRGGDRGGAGAADVCRDGRGEPRRGKSRRAWWSAIWRAISRASTTACRRPACTTAFCGKSSSRWSRRPWWRPAETRSARPTCWGSTATRCARKSATWTSRSCGPAASARRLIRTLSPVSIPRSGAPRRGIVAIGQHCCRKASYC